MLNLDNLSQAPQAVKQKQQTHDVRSGVSMSMMKSMQPITSDRTPAPGMLGAKSAASPFPTTFASGPTSYQPPSSHHQHNPSYGNAPSYPTHQQQHSFGGYPPQQPPPYGGPVGMSPYGAPPAGYPPQPYGAPHGGPLTELQLHKWEVMVLHQ